ncbi:MAG: porin family protein [Nitrospira sp.]|nr:porin family protein [Nitrospira sp.]
MRNLIVLIFASCAACGTASGADLDMHPPTPMIPAPLYTWSGFYFGANAGFGWELTTDTSTLNAAGPALFRDTQAANANGIIGGGQMGINYQNGYWVEGLEGDFQGSSQRAAHSFTCPGGACSALAIPATINQDLNWFGTVRTRLGFAPLERVLLYATGGLAYGQLASTSTLPGTVRASNVNPGWTAGAGIEAFVAENWTVRVEYLYLDFSRVSDTFSSSVASTGGATLDNVSSTHLTDNIVRVGVNYKFNWWIIPKY